ncbi:MAG: 50S ribosomal protein L33 [Bacilli bacterium]|nr:50S ribosomal protein L33 [Bacilli bacterium]
MAKKSDARANIELKCSECGFIIRPTEKNKKNTPDKLEVKKYCSKCRKTTDFKEKK